MVSAIVSFLISVAAGMICHYLCKWLDRNDTDNQPRNLNRK